MNRIVSAGIFMMMVGVATPGYCNNNVDSVGKPVNGQVTPAAPVPTDGVAEETPNQRRHRLGQPIPVYAEAEYGEALETPNHRAQRLRQEQEPELARLH